MKKIKTILLIVMTWLMFIACDYSNQDSRESQSDVNNNFMTQNISNVIMQTVPISPISPISIGPIFKIPKKYTIIVHFAVDNNLARNLENTTSLISNNLQVLESIRAIDIFNQINIVVLLDGPAELQTQFHDGYYYLTGGNFQSDLVVSKSEINSGGEDDIKDFMDWAVENNPAEKYIYSIFSTQGLGFVHSQVTGANFCNDKSPAGESLTHMEIGEVAEYLKDLTGKRIELFYPVGSMMGGIELAYEIRNNVKYLLSSEETAPLMNLRNPDEFKNYWPYFGLGILSYTPQVNGNIAGISVCNYAYELLVGMNMETPQTFFTLSLIDLHWLDDLYDAIDSYAAYTFEVFESIDFSIPTCIDMADNLFTFYEWASNLYPMGMDYNNYFYPINMCQIDMGSYFWYLYMNCTSGGMVDYIDNLIDYGCIQESVFPDWTNSMLEVITLLDEVVIYKKKFGFPVTSQFYSVLPNDSFFEYHSGLSIFHNIENSNYIYPYGDYEQNFAFGNNTWAELVKRMTLRAKIEKVAKVDRWEPDAYIYIHVNENAPAEVTRTWAIPHLTYGQVTTLPNEPGLDNSYETYRTFHERIPHPTNSYPDHDFIQINVTPNDIGKTYKFETIFLNENNQYVGDDILDGPYQTMVLRPSIQQGPGIYVPDVDFFSMITANFQSEELDEMCNTFMPCPPGFISGLRSVEPKSHGKMIHEFTEPGIYFLDVYERPTTTNEARSRYGLRIWWDDNFNDMLFPPEWP